MIRVARPFSWFSGLLPFGIALAAVFVSVLPLGAGEGWGAAGPQLVLAMVYYWAARAPRLMPPPAVFALGLAVDFVSAGPLGVWALVFVVMHAASLWLGARLEGRGFAVAWLGFGAVAAVSGALAWGLGSLYFATALAPEPLMFGAAASVAAYPAVAVVSGLLARLARR